MISRHAEEMDFEIDTWVAVKYNEIWFPGVTVKKVFF